MCSAFLIWKTSLVLGALGCQHGSVKVYTLASSCWPEQSSGRQICTLYPKCDTNEWATGVHPGSFQKVTIDWKSKENRKILNFKKMEDKTIQYCNILERLSFLWSTDKFI